MTSLNPDINRRKIGSYTFDVLKNCSWFGVFIEIEDEDHAWIGLELAKRGISMTWQRP